MSWIRPELDAARSTVAVMPRIVAVVGIANPKLVASRFALVARLPRDAVASELFDDTMFDELVQPDPEPAERSLSAPVIVTLPPTSTVVSAPVILPEPTRQMPPRLATGIVTVTSVIVRQELGSSWYIRLHAATVPPDESP